MPASFTVHVLSQPASAETSSSTGDSYTLHATRHSLLLIGYFRSGWAFLIPYLAAYLLYAWFDWPVNSGPMRSIPEAVEGLPLLHVYLALHVTHAILAGLALWGLLRKTACLLPHTTRGPYQPTTHYPTIESARDPEPVETQLATLSYVAPWLFLAAYFYIPGIYLEWPSDPWEHLRRINEWHLHSSVTAHSAWTRFGYFLPYSLTGFATGFTQLNWLNVYYTAICLLLSWQYYRLARAVGLGERASFVFVLLTALTLGNDIFSFYRYYGLSSSILAQVGAIALTRIALEASKQGTRELVTSGLERPAIASFYTSHISQIASVSALLALTAANHPQGLGIAGLGILAVVLWRLIEWRIAMICWLALAAVFLSVATVLWFPRHPTFDEIYRAQGWLTAWYGFNLFAPSSPSVERSLHIFGIFGVLNLAIGFWLVLRKNHISGWLTVLPVIALCLPCVSVPLAALLISHGGEGYYILVFHRLFLVIPSGLPLVVLFNGAISHQRPLPRIFSLLVKPEGFLPLLSSLIVFTGLSSTGPSYNRLWHSLVRTPDDLRMTHAIAYSENLLTPTMTNSSQLLTTTGIGFVLKSTGVQNTPHAQRDIAGAIDLSAKDTMLSMHDPVNLGSRLYYPSWAELHTPFSLAGVLSGHWPQSKVALDHAARQELNALASQKYWTGTPKKHGTSPAQE